MVDKYLNRCIPAGECLVWQGCVNSDGYPRATINYCCNIKLHRYIFEAINGYSPEVVRHSCDNILCLNPDHLLAGTPAENMKDRSDRARTFKHVSEDEVSSIYNLKNSGLTQKQVALTLNISRKRVEYVLNKRVRRIVICAES